MKRNKEIERKIKRVNHLQGDNKGRRLLIFQLP